MKTPRLVFACNHYVKETFSECLTKRVVRSTEPPSLSDDITSLWLEKYCCRDVIVSPSSDILEGNITITRSNCEKIEFDKDEPFSPVVSTNPEIYRAGFDFDITVKSSRNGQYIFVDWLKDEYRKTKTNLPDRYQIKIWYNRLFVKQYSSKDCPRCCGDGWYAGLFEEGNANAGFAEKANRLVQAFFKYIYTRKQEDGFGSSLLSSIGKYSMSDNQMLRSIINSEIDSFATYYKDKTSTMMLDGYTFNDDEILNSYYITGIEEDNENFSIKVSVRFYTMNENSFSVDIVLPEEN